MPKACEYTCDVDLTHNRHTCSGPVKITALADSRAAATVDMSHFAQMYLNFTICSPQGWMLHIADSPTCDGYGGDAASSSNDAEVNLIDKNVHFFANDFGHSVMLQNLPNYLDATGCTTRTLWFADQRVESRGDGPPIVKDSSYLLRINPPLDIEGTPDALWYLGMNRVVSGRPDRQGSGLRQLKVCLQ